MGEEFYAIIKLISGEEIFSLVSVDDNDGETVIILQNPITVKSFIHNGHSLLKVKPWVELSDEDIFVIRFDKILTMTESKNKKLIEVYHNYLDDTDDDSSSIIYGTSGKVTVSQKMGYISSVEDARKKLEEIYKDLKES
jgi:hypothetical protein